MQKLLPFRTNTPHSLCRKRLIYWNKMKKKQRETYVRLFENLIQTLLNAKNKISRTFMRCASVPFLFSLLLLLNYAPKCLFAMGQKLVPFLKIFNKNTATASVTAAHYFCLPPIYLHNLKCFTVVFGTLTGWLAVFVCRKCLFDVIISGNKCYYNECIICLITKLYNNFCQKRTADWERERT